LACFAGQNGSLSISGSTLEVDLSSYKERPAKFVSYRVYRDGELVEAGKSSYRGQYKIDLEFGANYEVVFMEERYVNKKIKLDLSDPNKAVREKGYKFKMDVTLFEADNHSLYDFLNTSAFVQAELNGSQMKVDEDHMKRMQDKIDMTYRESVVEETAD